MLGLNHQIDQKLTNKNELINFIISTSPNELLITKILMYINEFIKKKTSEVWNELIVTTIPKEVKWIISSDNNKIMNWIKSIKEITAFKMN